MNDRTHMIVTASKDTGLDARDVLRELLPTIGYEGKVFGRPDMAEVFAKPQEKSQ